MDDDWEHRALSAKHFHSRAGHDGRERSRAAFDVRRSFGTYQVQCAAAAQDDEGRSPGSKVEILRLARGDPVLLGHLMIPHVMDVALVLAADRPTLQTVVEGLESSRGGEGAGTSDGLGDGAEDEERAGVTDRGTDRGGHKDRFQVFEKNSFRSPKFWLAWKGKVRGTESSREHRPEAGSGYVVFSGNHCRKFKGVIDCKSLGWENVSIAGWKATSRSERDFGFLWATG